MGHCRGGGVQRFGGGYLIRKFLGGGGRGGEEEAEDADAADDDDGEDFFLVRTRFPASSRDCPSAPDSAQAQSRACFTMRYSLIGQNEDFFF